MTRSVSSRLRFNVACAAAILLAFAGYAEASDSPPASQPLEASTPPAQLIISLADQRIDLYRGLERIESAPVSSGRKRYATPTGIYSILQKRKWHRSNLYSAAPMPFMQRITWSGMALHAGHLPGYPASHGCIRLEKEFARRLFSMTGIGTDVIVAAEADIPRAIEHKTLFQLPGVGQAAETRVASLTGTSGKAIADAAQYSHLDAFQASAVLEPRHSGPPLRILITRRTGRERIKDAQALLAELGHDPGEIDGYVGRDTGSAILEFQRDSGLKPTGVVTDELIDALYEAAGRDAFDGHLYVRQNYVDLFDVPVLIDEPAESLGTHLFTALPFDADAPRVAWTATTLGGENTPDAVATLSRVKLSAAIRRRISGLLTPSSTVIITDQGLGRETGKGTDFIVQPR